MEKPSDSWMKGFTTAFFDGCSLSQTRKGSQLLASGGLGSGSKWFCHTRQLLCILFLSCFVCLFVFFFREASDVMIKSEGLIQGFVHECSQHLICNSPKLDTVPLFTSRWMDKQAVARLYNGTLLSKKRDWTADTHNNVDESENNHVEWKEPNEKE